MNNMKNLDQSDPRLAEGKLFIDLEDHWAKREIIELIKRQVIQLGLGDLFHPEMKITTEQFIRWIVRSRIGDNEVSDFITYATEKGLIEDYDLVNLNELIERRQVARIVHDTLRFEFNEQDEQDWTAAKNLKDLYSCRTCVQHITQVYVKGIVNPDQPDFFNLTGNLTRAQAAIIVLKMIDRTQRTPKIEVEKSESVELEPSQARELLQKDKSALLFDVRSIEAYQKGHLEGSKSLPLETINNNPHTVSQNMDTPIILYCQKGYSSSLAAERLVNAGYNHVYTIPGVSQFQYKLVHK